MLQNYWKIAIRHLIGNKLYSILNIVGYAIGIAAFLVILMYVKDELNYDGFHEKGDRIYRLNRVRERPEGLNLSRKYCRSPRSDHGGGISPSGEKRSLYVSLSE